jgi:hypothetical protein
MASFAYDWVNRTTNFTLGTLNPQIEILISLGQKFIDAVLEFCNDDAADPSKFRR